MFKQVTQIIIWLKSVQDCRLRYAVYGRTGFCTFNAFGKQPVAAANGKVLDRPLRGRVIDTQMSVFQIGFEVFFLI